MRWLRGILELLFPSKCVLCGNLLGKEELDLCRTCREQTPEYPKGKRKLQFLDSFTSVWYYEEYPRRSILRYKFGRRRNYAPAYGRLMAMKVQRDIPETFDCVTWVPVSSLRKLSRGFDQVELLSRHVGRELEIPSIPLLKKIRHNRRQSGLADAAMRRANVLGAYKTVNLSHIQGKKILLLDDVLTTGATVEECARVLLTAGAKEVHCAAIAARRK